MKSIDYIVDGILNVFVVNGNSETWGFEFNTRKATTVHNGGWPAASVNGFNKIVRARLPSGAAECGKNNNKRGIVLDGFGNEKIKCKNAAIEKIKENAFFGAEKSGTLAITHAIDGLEKTTEKPGGWAIGFGKGCHAGDDRGNGTVGIEIKFDGVGASQFEENENKDEKENDEKDRGHEVKWSVR
jgi:hypothetical protein